MNKIINGDALSVLKTLADNSIDCCVTSPPYFGLRDYGHPEQIGLEESPEQFIEKLVQVFEEVRRVLKPEGTLWLNLGDSYSGSGMGSGGTYETSKKQSSNKGSNYQKDNGIKIKFKSGCKPKDLIGVPWMVAFALRANGWYLRQDIIWHKPNPMPESVKDRCTKAHEYIFLLSKSQRYYYDYKSILQDVSVSVINDKRLYDENLSVNRPDKGFNGAPDRGSTLLKRKSGNLERKPGSSRGCPEGSGSNVAGSVPWEGLKANKKSVWTVTTKPFKEAHFATFPEDLIVDCIKAGCPDGGIVLDPFMGAGTTALVAAKLGRKFIGIELNEIYVKMANERINKELGFFSPLT